MRSGKSRRWCDAEVDRLIELLEERPCLWDVFCKEYHVREKRERAYEEIENKLEIDLNDIKTKIVGLRSQLRRELSKTNNKKSGQGLGDNYKSNWIYWDSLQFLVPVMQARKSKDNLPDHQNSSSPESFDSFIAPSAIYCSQTVWVIQSLLKLWGNCQPLFVWWSDLKANWPKIFTIALQTSSTM